MYVLPNFKVHKTMKTVIMSVLRITIDEYFIRSFKRSEITRTSNAKQLIYRTIEAYNKNDQSLNQRLTHENMPSA